MLPIQHIDLTVESVYQLLVEHLSQSIILQTFERVELAQLIRAASEQFPDEKIFEISLVSEGRFLVRAPAVFDQISDGAPFSIGIHHFHVQRNTDEVSIQSSDTLKWVRILRVPWQMRSPPILGQIVQSFSTFVTFDDNTKHTYDLRWARVKVEIPRGDQIPHFVPFEVKVADKKYVMMEFEIIEETVHATPLLQVLEYVPPRYSNVEIISPARTNVEYPMPGRFPIEYPSLLPRQTVGPIAGLKRSGKEVAAGTSTIDDGGATKKSRTGGTAQSSNSDTNSDQQNRAN